jgi:O-acetyl-ADP-ribose deacetylase (regulator of RNase III)
VKIRVVSGDITEAPTEAIVNAANNHLWMGSGVAGAIKRKGGQQIEDEAVAKGPIRPGEAVATAAGELPQKFVIHAAGMGQDLQTSEGLVYKSTAAALRVAIDLGVNSVAFPAIGTGVGGLEIGACAEQMKRALDSIASDAGALEEVLFVIYGEENRAVFAAAFES